MNTSANNTRRNLGLRVNEFRKAQKLSLRKFASMVDMDYAYMCEIESGRANPTVTVLAKIAAGFGVHIKDLFDSD